MSYVLASGNNQTETGEANGNSIFYPPETDLIFYSYGTASTPACPNLDTRGVVGALWIQVPVNINGSYNLMTMSVYFTPGVLTNNTVLTTITNNTTSLLDYCNSTQGTGLYVTVLSDAGQPIQGVQVGGTMVGQMNGGMCYYGIGPYTTNSTGSVLITPNIGSYYLLTVQYQGKNYTAKAPIEPMLTTYVTLKVPSGNVTITEE